MTRPVTCDDWLATPYAQAKRRIYDIDGAFAKRGDVGRVCDVDWIAGFVVVDFPATGPTLCYPAEIGPVLTPPIGAPAADPAARAR